MSVLNLNSANLALQRAQAAFGAATTTEEREAARAAGQVARAAGATDAGAQAVWQQMRTPVQDTAVPTVKPEEVAGFDPQWFQNLSPAIQERANIERQRVGAPVLPASRPLTYQESIPQGFPAFDQLPTNVQAAINQATAQAFHGQGLGQVQGQGLGQIVQGLRDTAGRGEQILMEEAELAREQNARLRQQIDSMLQYTPDARQPMTWDEALERARQMVAPGAELARQQLLENMTRQFDVLPYELAGRGQLRGGLAEGGYEGLTQARARGLSELEMRRQASAIELADSIRKGDEASVAAEVDRAFRNWSTRFQAALQYSGQLTDVQHRNAQLDFQRGANAFELAWRMMTYPNEVTRNAINDAANIHGGFLEILDSPVKIEQFVNMLIGMM